MKNIKGLLTWAAMAAVVSAFGGYIYQTGNDLEEESVAKAEASLRDGVVFTEGTIRKVESDKKGEMLGRLFKVSAGYYVVTIPKDDGVETCKAFVRETTRPRLGTLRSVLVYDCK